MHETKEPLQPVEQAPAAQPDDATWQTPAFDVVDTALEVTAYSLSTR
ncbi:pyrroloquinoline quinone precursor peptide PqqA [Streptomyces sp. NPDC093568]